MTFKNNQVVSSQTKTQKMKRVVFSLIRSKNDFWFLICLLAFEEDALEIFHSEGELTITRNIVLTKKEVKDFIEPMKELVDKVFPSESTGIYGLSTENKVEAFRTLMQSAREAV